MGQAPSDEPTRCSERFRPVAQEVQKYFSLHRQTERSTQQGSSAASSLSPSSSLLESNSEDDSSVQPSHQTSPVRQTERGTAVAAVQFLKLLNALDPSTGNLTTEQLTNGVTPRAARATPEYLRSRIPARPEAAPAEPAAPAKPEPKRDPPRRMSAEQHSAHTIEMDQHSAHTTEMLLPCITCDKPMDKPTITDIELLAGNFERRGIVRCGPVERGGQEPRPSTLCVEGIRAYHLATRRICAVDSEKRGASSY